MNSHNNNYDSNLLHIECNKLIKRKSKQKICQEVLNYFEIDNKTKNNIKQDFDNIKEDFDNINPIIKVILCFCTKIEK